MLVVTVAVAGRRIAWLVRLIRSGKAAKGRTRRHPASACATRSRRSSARRSCSSGTRRASRTSSPSGASSSSAPTIVEAFGALVISRDFAFPIFGRARWLGFLEDFFAVAVLLGIIYFAINRLRNAPERKKRASRFYGSHNGPAWVVLGMIALVVVTLLMYRGAQSNTGHFPFGRLEGAVRVVR